MAMYGEVVIISYVSPDKDGPMEQFLTLVTTLPRDSKFALFVTMAADVRVASDANRKRLLEVLNRKPTNFIARALVVSSTGFASAMQRATASRIALSSQVDFPMRIFDDKVAAAAWVAGQLDNCSAAELDKVIKQVVERQHHVS